MFRRVVTLLLAPTLLLQGIGSSLSQEGECQHGPAGHDQRPHFHLCMVGLYHHDHAAGHADRCDGPKGCDERSLGRQQPAEDHDDDAVYVTALAAFGPGSDCFQVAHADHPAPAPTDAAVCGQALYASSSPPTHPPPSLLHCRLPLYLRTLPLLI